MSILRIPEPEKPKQNIPPEELEKAFSEFKLLQEKVENGEELTLDDVKKVVIYNRLNRDFKFSLVTEKRSTSTIKKLEMEQALSLLKKELLGDEEKEQLDLYIKNYKPKRISREAAIEYFSRPSLNIFEQKDLDNFVEKYKGKKLTKKDQGLLLITREQRKLNIIERKDLHRSLYGDVVPFGEGDI